MFIIFLLYFCKLIENDIKLIENDMYSQFSIFNQLYSSDYIYLKFFIFLLFCLRMWVDCYVSIGRFITYYYNILLCCLCYC